MIEPSRRCGTFGNRSMSRDWSSRINSSNSASTSSSSTRLNPPANALDTSYKEIISRKWNTTTIELHFDIQQLHENLPLIFQYLQVLIIHSFSSMRRFLVSNYWQHLLELEQILIRLSKKSNSRLHYFEKFILPFVRHFLEFLHFYPIDFQAFSFVEVEVMLD